MASLPSDGKGLKSTETKQIFLFKQQQILSKSKSNSNKT